MDPRNSEVAMLRDELREYHPIRFQQQSREYEEALEQEVLTKDQTIAELRGKMDELTERLKVVTERYHRCEADLSKAQEASKSLQLELEKHRSEKRELELLNDDWERSKR